MILCKLPEFSVLPLLIYVTIGKLQKLCFSTLELCDDRQTCLTSLSLYWKEHSRNPQLCHEPLRERREPKRRLPFAVWKVTCSCVGHSFLTVGFLSQFCGQATVTCSLAATGTAWGWVPEPVCLDSYPSSTTSGKFLPFSVPRSLQLKSRGNDSTHFLESLSRLS